MKKSGEQLIDEATARLGLVKGEPISFPESQNVWTCLKCKRDSFGETPNPVLCGDCLATVLEERHAFRIGIIPAHMLKIGVPKIFVNRNEIKFPAILKPYLDEEQKGVCLHGPVGVGKSFGLALLIREWLTVWSITHGGIEKGLPDSWRWIDWVDFTMELQDCYQRGESENTAYRQLKAAADTPILVIDDLGAEQNKTPFVKQATYLLFDRREKRGLTTHVTTNLALPKLDSEYGARISDRLGHVCDVIEMGGASRRLS